MLSFLHSRSCQIKFFTSTFAKVPCEMYFLSPQNERFLSLGELESKSFVKRSLLISKVVITIISLPVPNLSYSIATCRMWHLINKLNKLCIKYSNRDLSNLYCLVLPGKKNLKFYQFNACKRIQPKIK